MADLRHAMAAALVLACAGVVASAQPPAPARRSPCAEHPRVPAEPVRGRSRGNVSVVWNSTFLPPDDSAIGDIDEEIESRAAARRFPASLPLAALRRCYDARLRESPELRGGMSVEMVRADDGSTRVRVTGESIGDEALRACAESALRASPPARLPRSPFYFQLAYCPTHESACFAGAIPTSAGVSRPIDPVVAGLLDDARTEIASCVARGLRRSQRGSIPFFVDVRDGRVRGLGSDNQQVTGLDETAQHAAFRCAADAMSGRCVSPAGTPTFRFAVLIAVQPTGRRPPRVRAPEEPAAAADCLGSEQRGCRTHEDCCTALICDPRGVCRYPIE